MNYQLIGDAMQTLLVNLQPGESVRAEPGALLFCNDALRFDARTHGGLAGGVERAVASGALAANPIGGHSVSHTNFECVAPGGSAAFCAPYPGKIHVLELSGEAWLCQRDCLLCFTSGITCEIALARKFGAGLFAGEGFVLLKLSGTGTAWIHLGGNMIESELAAGQKLQVDAGCLACCPQSVSVDLRFDGGYRNAYFGGEGTHFADLTGPGKALLQTMPLARLVARIATAGISSAPAPVGALGHVGDLFRS